MKVLFITNMYPVADYIYFGIHVKEQIEALQKYKDITAEVFFINGREKKINYFKSIFKIKEKITNGKYDLIHIHYGISGLFLLFCKPLVPLVITLHSGELYQKKGILNHLIQKSLTMAIIKKVCKIIVLNDDMLHMLKYYEDKLIKLPCGVDLQLFTEKKVNRTSGRILIGFPGNKARKEKNYELFSNIVNSLIEIYPLEIVEFHNLSRHEVIKKLNEIDLLLMTSTVEGSPQIIKEAMSCNKPVISTSVGDIKDLLKDVKNSYVINSFKPESFLESLKLIIALPVGERNSNGRERLLKLGLDSKSVSESLYSIYKSLL